MGEEEDGRSSLGDRVAKVDEVGEDDLEQWTKKHGVGNPATYHCPGQGSRS